MKKEKIKNLLLIVIVALVTSFVTAYGVSSTFDSSNVCYKVDNNTGASVQDTIDDLYGRASDYSELKSYFKNNPTSYLYDNGIVVSSGRTTDPSPGIRIHDSNSIERGSLYFTKKDNKTYLTAGDSSGNWGGILDLRGNPIMINGVDVSNYQSVNASFSISNLSSSSKIYAYKIGKLLFVSGYINSNSKLATNIEIASISATPVFETFCSPVSDAGSGSRLKLGTDGKLYTELNLDAGRWYSFSFTTIIN